MSKEKESENAAVPILGEITHPGRPKDEEPHVKRSIKKKKEVVEYLVRVDLDRMGIDENQFEEMKELFKMFDADRDGVLSIKEFERLMAVLGRAASEDKARKFALTVSVDTAECSVSFTEYLNMMANQRNDEPTPESLLEAFEVFDKEGLGRISEAHFRKIMRGKFGEDTGELDEMMNEYRRVHCCSVPETPEGKKYIDYKKFVDMLQQ